jgi:hypothetical protein
MAMELGKMSYQDVLAMPVNRLEEYLTWKIKYDRDKEKAKSDSLDQIQM